MADGWRTWWRRRMHRAQARALWWYLIACGWTPHEIVAEAHRIARLTRKPGRT